MALINGDFNMAIRLSGLGGSGGLPKLAPDLNFFTSTIANNGNQQRLTLDPSGGLTTALSITGKFAIVALGFTNLTAETITVEMTIDGVVIHNETFTSETSLSILNAFGGAVAPASIPVRTGPIVCDSSFLLRIQTATDTNVTLNYMVKPIL